MRINRTKTTVVALATASLLALGSVAYAGDDVEVTQGGTATNGSNTATATSNDNDTYGGTGGAATGGAAQTNQACNTNTTTTQPDPYEGEYKGGYTLINVSDNNIPICPIVNVPILSPSHGGDAKGGSADGGSVHNSANAEQNASADAGKSDDNDKHKKSYKKSKKCKKYKKYKKCSKKYRRYY